MDDRKANYNTIVGEPVINQEITNVLSVGEITVHSDSVVKNQDTSDAYLVKLILSATP